MLYAMGARVNSPAKDMAIGRLEKRLFFTIYARKAWELVLIRFNEENIIRKECHILIL